MRRRALFRLATSEDFERGVGRVGLRGRAWRRAARYVAGEHLEDALRATAELADRGLEAAIDCFGENAADRAAARATIDAYLGIAAQLARLERPPHLALDLSHIGLDVDRALCAEGLAAIAAAVPDGVRVQVGAEEARRAADTQRTVLEVGAPNLNVTLQANLRRSATDWPALVAAGVPIRLVKGAYVEPPGVALPYGEAVDVAYLELAQAIDAAGGALSLATHDPVLRAALPDHPLELLLGVRSADAEALARAGRRVCVYVPFGEDWFRYWMRRVAEAQGA